MHPPAWVISLPWHWRHPSRSSNLFSHFQRTHYNSLCSRPKTSFNPLTHPFKSAHLILWPVIRKYVYIGLLLLCLGLGLTLFFSNLPNQLLKIPLK